MNLEEKKAAALRSLEIPEEIRHEPIPEEPVPLRDSEILLRVSASTNVPKLSTAIARFTQEAARSFVHRRRSHLARHQGDDSSERSAGHEGSHAFRVSRLLPHRGKGATGPRVFGSAVSEAHVIQVVSEMGLTVKVGESETFQAVPVVISILSDAVHDGRVFDWPVLQEMIRETFEGKAVPLVEFEGQTIPATVETLAMALWEGVESFLQQDRPEGVRRTCSSVQVSLGAQTAVFAPSSE